MPHTVEVRHFGYDLAAATSELRDWLRQKCVQPAEFEYSAGGPGITFRVHFTERSEAEAFASAFHGWLNDGSDPDGIARWAFTELPPALPPNSRE
jgi:hypothetical protein